MEKEKSNKGLLTFMFVAVCLLLYLLPVIDLHTGELLLTVRTYNAWIRTTVFIVVFLITTFLIVPHLLFKGEKKLFIFSVIVLVAMVAIFWELFMPIFNIDQVNQADLKPLGPLGIPPERGFNPNMRPLPPPEHEHLPKPLMMINNVLISFLVIGLGTSISVTLKWFRDDKALKELEKENLASELAFLKNQVSPHFFLNTLNNIHALVDIDKKDSQKAIIKLSNMMRYLLYESEKGETTLQKEIDFMNAYIDLMKLRISDEVQMEIDFQTEIPDISLPPLLFIAFIENAFKHGISYREKSFIRISLKLDNKFIEFSTSNSIFDKTDEIKEYSGIGLANIRKRLDLIYGESYQLNIMEQKNEYSVKLKVPFHDH